MSEEKKGEGMTLKVTIKKCKNLKRGDIFTSDPFVFVQPTGQGSQGTRTRHNTLNPKYDESFTFENVSVGEKTVFYRL